MIINMNNLTYPIICIFVMTLYVYLKSSFGKTKLIYLIASPSPLVVEVT